MKFDEVKAFHDGIAGVKKNGKWSYVNQEGKMLTPFQFDEVEDFSEGFGRVKKYGKWYFINAEGREFSADNVLECFCGAERDIK